MSLLKQISRNDFEVYTVRMPLFLTKRKREAYIVGELEKNHPCFSDKCCWRTDYSITKKGLVASIAVMDKVRLARYKKENPGKFLLIKGFNGRFSVKRIFVLLLLIAIFAGTLFECVKLFEKRKNAAFNEVTEETVIEQDNSEKDIHNIEQIFDEINKNHALIKNLEVNNAFLLIEVEGCFPQDISCRKCIFSKIKYEKNVPVFSLRYNFVKPEEPIVPDNELFLSELRKCLLENKVNLVDENKDKNNLIQFTFTIRRIDAEKTLNNLLSLCNKNDICVSAYSLSENDTSVCCTMTFSETNELYKRIFELTAEYAFYSDVEEEKSMTPVNIEVKNIDEIETNELIGSIKKNGTNVSFFKDADGKIKRVIE